MEDAVGGGDGFFKLAAFVDGHGAGFFAIDVLACTGGADACGRVPTLASGDDHGIDARVLDDGIHLAMSGAVFVFIMAVDGAADDFGALGLRVADGDELDVWPVEEVLEDDAPARTKANATDDDAVAGGHGTIEAERAAGDDGAQANV